MFFWINSNAAAIQAISAVVMIFLTIALMKSASAQANAAESLREIERQRDHSDDPRVFIFFDGYHPETKVASFVMQNSGGSALFLRSLVLDVPGQEVADFEMEGGRAYDSRAVPRNQLLDLVIRPEKVEKFRFKLKGAYGQGFDLLAQLYIGAPVRLSINTGELNGYELRAEGGVRLRSFKRGVEQ